jgi:hypothetical protein
MCCDQNHPPTATRNKVAETHPHYASVKAWRSANSSAYLLRVVAASRRAVPHVATCTCTPCVHLTTTCRQRSMPRTHSHLQQTHIAVAVAVIGSAKPSNPQGSQRLMG